MAQGRRVRLVIRRIEPLTVLRVAILFWASVYVILLVAAVMLWTAATATGLRENVESFVGDLIAAEDFTFKAGQMLRASVVGGAVLVAMGSFATMMMAVLYNLIADVVGGVAVIFEEKGARGAYRRAARQAAKPAKPSAAGATRASLGRIGSRIADATKAAAAKAGEARNDDKDAGDPTGDKQTSTRPGAGSEQASRSQR